MILSLKCTYLLFIHSLAMCMKVAQQIHETMDSYYVLCL